MDLCPVDEQLHKLAQSVSRATSLEELIRPLLGLLQRITGLQSTYLTTIDQAAGLQHVLFTHNSAELDIPEGLDVPWEDTLCKRALDEQQFLTTDVSGHWSDSEAAAALGLETYLSIPVYVGDNELYGTLCGASARSEALDDGVFEVLNLFANVIAHHVERERQAASSAQRAEDAEHSLAEMRLMSGVGDLCMKSRSLSVALDAVADRFRGREIWTHALPFELSSDGRVESLQSIDDGAATLVYRMLNSLGVFRDDKAPAFNRLSLDVSDDSHSLAGPLQAAGFTLPCQLALLSAWSDARLEGGVALVVDSCDSLPQGESVLCRNISNYLSLLAARLENHYQLEEANRQLTVHAMHDPLTGLPNRRYLVEYLQRTMDRIRRSGGVVHIAFVDLDNFKIINDTHGHDIGDQLLRRMSGLLQAAARSSDLPSRFGGDEFVVVASSDVTEHPAYERDKIAERLTDALSGVIQLDGVTLNYAGPSVGVISWQKGDPGDADSAIADADKAMYRVKKRRRSGLSS